MKFTQDMLQLTSPLYTPSDLTNLIALGEDYQLLEDKTETAALMEIIQQSIFKTKEAEWPWMTQPLSPQSPKPIEWYVKQYTSDFLSNKLFDLSSSTIQISNIKEYLKSLKKLWDEENAMELSYMQTTQKKKEGATSTSCTTAKNTEDPVAAASSETCRTLFDTLKAAFGPGTSQQQTSSVSSYISARMNTQTQIFSLKGEEEPYQMILRCWKTSDLRHVKPQEKHLHTYASMNVHFGEDSPLHPMINQLVLKGAQGLVEKGGSFWEKQ